MKKRIISLCMAIVLIFAILPQFTMTTSAATVNEQSAPEYVIAEQITYNYRSSGEEYVQNRGQYIYDDFGRLSEFVHFIGEDFENSHDRYYYDAYGRLIRQEADGNYSTFEYDEDGNKTKMNYYIGDELALIYEYEYDGNGTCQQYTIVSPEGKKNAQYFYTYTDNGDIKTQSSFTYSSYGENAPFGGFDIVEYTYDGDKPMWAKNISGYLDENGQMTEPNNVYYLRIVHDEANRVWQYYMCDEAKNTIGLYQELRYDENENSTETLIYNTTTGQVFMRTVYTYAKLILPFSPRKDGWTFANAAQSFAEEPTSYADDYFIPRERYDALFGSSYVDSTEGLYTEEWGGNCAGMSATAILFFLESLDWEGIDAEYSEDLLYPNSFYRTVNLHNQSQSYYPAIGNDTEVTRLIEAYQLYINAIDKSRLVENLDNTYFEEDVTEKKTLFGSEYIVNHVADGTYIATMLAEFQEAYNENNPLLIALQADGFGHGIVSRTDLKPEDMGDGWWRIYVYDPNKPYINESVTNTVSGLEAEPTYTFGCNTLVDNGGDIYLELNPSLNQWRYCTSVNSNSSDNYIGSSPSGELLWKNYYHDTTPENENDDEGKKNNAKIPDYFYTIDLTDLSMGDFANPHFDSTSAWIPENDLAIAVDGNTDCSIYASTGELVAIVEDGDAFVLSDAGSYDAYIDLTEDGGSLGGKIYLPNDVYTVYYTSGAVQFLGSDNALSFSCEGAAELTVDITINSLQIVAQEDGTAAVKCANVTSTDECSYVDTEGTLAAGETFTIAYSDENEVEASTDSKDGEFQLYQKDADQGEAVATKIIKANSLWWLWIVGGAVIIGVAVLFILMKRKNNK